MLRLSCFITGEDYRLLRQDTPASRKKVFAMSSALFVPVILWLISTYLLGTQAMGCATGSALMAAIIAASMIFLLERNIIMARNSVTIAIFRILLGFLIATIGSLSIDEVLFRGDIDQQMSVIKENLKIKKEEEITDKYKPQIEQHIASIHTKELQWQEALIAVSSEADGSSGSGRKGVHAITIKKQEIADQVKENLENTKGQLESLQSNVQEEIKSAKADIDKSFNNHALLYRIKAMFDLVFSNWYMGIVYSVITLIFFFMEFLVIILKFTWSKTNYERKVEMIERIGEKRIRNLENRDLEYFDATKMHPAYKKLEKDMKNARSVSIFN